MGAGHTLRIPEAPLSPAGTAAEPRRSLGRYELVSLLARGGMGEVYLAKSRGVGGFERLVVVKCSLTSLPEHRDQMLLAEARLAATLQHANIVQVHDVDADGGTVFLAMEYLHGQDARSVLKQTWGRGQQLPLEHAVAIVLAVCGGLHYAHDKRDTDGSPLEIIHRDISPSNVFVTYDGMVKLIDFGIAKSTALPSETQLGTIKGKPGYMSPEQCRCESLDRRSDLFCVGILLYELTTGRRPFTGDSEYLLYKQIAEQPATPPSQIDSTYPAQLEAIVMRALAKDRRERFATAQELGEALREFATVQRLDVSQFALARYMASLFSEELAAWHLAQRAGQSLAEHVIKRTTASVTALQELPSAAPSLTSDSLHTTRPRGASRARLAWLSGGIAAAVLASTIAIAIAVRSNKEPAEKTEVHTPATEPTRVETAITPSAPAPPPIATEAPKPAAESAPTPAAPIASTPAREAERNPKKRPARPQPPKRPPVTTDPPPTPPPPPPRGPDDPI